MYLDCRGPIALSSLTFVFFLYYTFLVGTAYYELQRRPQPEFRPALVLLRLQVRAFHPTVLAIAPSWCDSLLSAEILGLQMRCTLVGFKVVIISVFLLWFTAGMPCLLLLLCTL